MRLIVFFPESSFNIFYIIKINEREELPFARKNPGCSSRGAFDRALVKRVITSAITSAI